MARPRAVIRTIARTVQIQEDLFAHAQLMLFSEFEGRVPFGKWSQYINDLIREDLRGKGAVV